MQEEVTQRTVALCVEATKLSAGFPNEKAGFFHAVFHLPRER